MLAVPWILGCCHLDAQQGLAQALLDNRKDSHHSRLFPAMEAASDDFHQGIFNLGVHRAFCGRHDTISRYHLSTKASLTPQQLLRLAMGCQN